ncbi:MAG: hypothetical protein WD077_04865 [Bacteroidia bacterium]
MDILYWVAGFLVLTVVIPNTTNFKERKAFSDKHRLEEARLHYHADSLGDSITIIPGKFYDRGFLFKFFFGEKYREIWNTPVTVAVFDYEENLGQLKPVDGGGGEQTISIDLEDQQEREWSLRSVNKDQIGSVPKILRPTIVRVMFRDQVSGMNPYGALITRKLSDSLGIKSLSPRMTFVPYDERLGDYNDRMAGRLAFYEENLNSSWKNSERWNNADDIVNTEDMFEIMGNTVVQFDTMRYLKNRLFDMLINDWDRHSGQWEWEVHEGEDTTLLVPIPKDRDVAFFVFNEGFMNKLALLFTNRLPSFRPQYGNLKARINRELDPMILKKVPVSKFIQTAKELQAAMTDEIIHEAFLEYPDAVYEMFGEQHQAVLKARLEKLTREAEIFHGRLQKM